MSVATAMIQIIGIYLLSNQVVPGRLIAIAPRMPCPSSPILLRSVTAEQAMNNAGVEEHEAIMVFARSDYSNPIGWTPAPMPDDPEKMYVKLDGEQIRFISNSSTKGPDLQAGTASNARPAFISDLGLPHVEGRCCANPQLRPEYLPSTGYLLAAAVLDFSNGRGNGCLLESGRKDTIVHIDNDGTLIVEGTKGETKKRITFNGAAYLIFANVPMDATGDSHCEASGPHNLAYSAMIRPCKRYVDCPRPQSDMPNCKFGPTLLTPNSSDTLILPYARIDAQCSNNQWP